MAIIGICESCTYDVSDRKLRLREMKRYLEEKEVHPQLLRDDEHDQLVRGGAEQEREHHRAQLAQPEARHRGRIHVPEKESVHGAVPLARELVPGS